LPGGNGQRRSALHGRPCQSPEVRKGLSRSAAGAPHKVSCVDGGRAVAPRDPLRLPFLHGVNYPWSTDGQTVFYGLDFGANVWGSHLGVSTRRAAVSRDFEEMAQLGFVVVRWFLFCDGRSGIVYDDRGFPLGLDDELFVDLDAALEIA